MEDVLHATLLQRVGSSLRVCESPRPQFYAAAAAADDDDADDDDDDDDDVLGWRPTPTSERCGLILGYIWVLENTTTNCLKSKPLCLCPWNSRS